MTSPLAAAASVAVPEEVGGHAAVPVHQARRMRLQPPPMHLRRRPIWRLPDADLAGALRADSGQDVEVLERARAAKHRRISWSPTAAAASSATSGWKAAPHPPACAWR